MKYLVFTFLSTSAFAGYFGEPGEYEEKSNDTLNEVIEFTAQEEATRLLNIARAAERWFEKNSIEPRVHEYDVPYELPMNEIKASGELSSTYALPPGGTSGVDEDSVLGTGYTIRVVKERVAGADKYRITATLGEKAPALPLTPPANCYVYGSTRLDGSVTTWNWHMLPSTSTLTLPYANTTCAAMASQMSTVESNINSAWPLFSPPNTNRPDSISCNVVTTIPGSATPPPLHYEDVIFCNFDYVTPATPTYCNGYLLITMQSGPMQTHNLSSLSHDCTASDALLYRAESNTKINDLGLDTTTPSCVMLNTHSYRCTATENAPPGGVGGNPGASTQCDVYVYDVFGVLGSTPEYHWDDTDCTGMNTATQTIMEFVEYEQHFNGEFALDTNGDVDPEVIHANRFAELHFDDTGSLGSMFASEMHYNSDNQSKLDQFVATYNFSNPNNQLLNCVEYTGALAPGEVKHKAICERDTQSFSTTLHPDMIATDYACLLTGNNCRLGDGDLTISIFPINHSIHPAKFEEWQGDDSHGVGSSHYYQPAWLTVSDGTLNDLVTAGYTYSLSLYFSGSDADGANVTCTSTHSGAAINLNNTAVELKAQVTETTNGRASASCSWTGTIYEYKNGVATGGQANYTFVISTEQED